MRPILALNCLLQIEQERSEEESSVVDALALAFRCACFCLASLIPFASYSPAPLFMRPRHFVQSCAICSHDPVGMLKSLREALRVSLNACNIMSAVNDHYTVFFTGFLKSSIHMQKPRNVHLFSKANWTKL